MQSFYNKKGTQDINKIIIDWANKANTFFFELWKERNTCQNEWEIHSGISKVVKHSLPLSRRTARNIRKRSFSGKRKLYCHVVNDRFYDHIISLIGMKSSLDFQMSQDKRVYNWVIFLFHDNILVIFVRSCLQWLFPLLVT